MLDVGGRGGEEAGRFGRSFASRLARLEEEVEELEAETMAASYGSGTAGIDGDVRRRSVQPTVTAAAARVRVSVQGGK